jgi:oligopeptide transport system substrate-binding protein
MRAGLARAATVSLLVALGACHHEAPAPSARSAHFALNSAPQGFDPLRAFSVTEGILQRQILESLTEYDPAVPGEARAQPLLAARWETSADGLRWTFTLREDAFFHDPAEAPLWPGGRRALGSADVVASFVQHADPRASSTNTWDAYQEVFAGLDDLRASLLAAGAEGDTILARALQEGVAGIRALDTRRVELTLNRPDGFLLQRLASQAFAVIPRERAGGAAELRLNAPIGSGPYFLAEWQTGQRAVLRRVPSWREELHADADGGSAPTDISFDLVRETAARGLMFEDGRLDRMSLALDSFSRFLQPDGLKPEWTARGYRLTRLQVPDTNFLIFNLRDPVIGAVPGDPEADRRHRGLRRALALAFPRDGWHQLLRGSAAAVPARTHLPPVVPEAAGLPDFPWLGPDLEAAARELAAAGYADGAGVPELVFDLTSDDPVTASVGELYLANLRRIGLRCRAQPNVWRNLMDRAARGEFQITLQSWVLDWPDAAMIYMLFDSAGIGRSTNLSQFADAGYDAALARLRGAADPAERARLCAELSAILADRLPALPIDHRVSYLLHQPWLRQAEGHPFDPLACKFIRLGERP